MTNESMVRDLTDAIQIVRDSRLGIASGPWQPWAFLKDVEKHLTEQRDKEFESQWSEVMS